MFYNLFRISSQETIPQKQGGIHMLFEFKKDMKRIFVICIASVIMAVNIKSFVRTGGLYPGGATGLTILIQSIALRFFHIQIPYTFVNLLLNAFPVYIGFKFIGKKFTWYSCLMIVLTSALTDIIPSYTITYDTLLISIFGGIINGLAISICLMVDATTGGTDFIAIYFSEKKGMDSFNIVLVINVLILLSAGFLFGWDKALYSIIFQFVSTQILHMMYQKYQHTTLFVVTNCPQQICQVIDNATHHGATIIEGEGSYEHHERSIVYSVVSSAEAGRLIHLIKQTDSNCFINTIKTDQLSGRFYNKPAD